MISQGRILKYHLYSSKECRMSSWEEFQINRVPIIPETKQVDEIIKSMNDRKPVKPLQKIIEEANQKLNWLKKRDIVQKKLSIIRKNTKSKMPEINTNSSNHRSTLTTPTQTNRFSVQRNNILNHRLTRKSNFMNVLNKIRENSNDNVVLSPQ